MVVTMVVMMVLARDSMTTPSLSSLSPRPRIGLLSTSRTTSCRVPCAVPCHCQCSNQCSNQLNIRSWPQKPIIWPCGWIAIKRLQLQRWLMGDGSWLVQSLRSRNFTASTYRCRARTSALRWFHCVSWQKKEHWFWALFWALFWAV